MKNVTILLIMMGLATITACSSNEANMKADESSASMSNDSMGEKNEHASNSEVGHASDDKMAADTNMDASSNKLNNKISVCKNGAGVRTISVIYKHGESTSCEVTYEKDTGVKTLWNAKSDLSYCVSKATEFVKKQEGWGWTCSNLE